MSGFIFILMIYLSIMVYEVFFDNILWRTDKNDKPISTIVRGALLVTASLMNDFYLNEGTWYTSLFLGVAIYFAFFDYIINWTLNRPFFYLGKNWFDRQLSKIPDYPRLWIQVFVLITSIIIYLNYNE